MTAKAKAQQLIKKMNCPTKLYFYDNLSGGHYEMVPMKDDQIQACALVACQEIISALENVEHSSAEIRYWTKVKSEIVRLSN